MIFMTDKEFKKFIETVDVQVCNVRCDLENFIAEASVDKQVDHVQLILDLISEAESLCDDIAKRVLK